VAEGTRRSFFLPLPFRVLYLFLSLFLSLSLSLSLLFLLFLSLICPFPQFEFRVHNSRTLTFTRSRALWYTCQLHEETHIQRRNTNTIRYTNRRTDRQTRSERGPLCKIATTLLVPLRRRRLGTWIGGRPKGLRGCNGWRRQPGEVHRVEYGHERCYGQR